MLAKEMSSLGLAIGLGWMGIGAIISYPTIGYLIRSIHISPPTSEIEPEMILYGTQFMCIISGPLGWLLFLKEKANFQKESARNPI